MRLKLRPAESIRSPRVLQLYWQGDDPLVGYDLFRRTMLRHVVPKVQGETVVPPSAQTSASFHEKVLRLLGEANGTGDVPSKSET